MSAPGSGSAVQAPSSRLPGPLVSVVAEIEQTSRELESRYAELRRRFELASERLEGALGEKQRLAGLLDAVLESIEAGVVLAGPREEIVATNAAAKRMGAVAAGPEDSVSLLQEQLRELGVGPHLIRPAGTAGPAWDVRVSGHCFSGLGECRLVLIQDVTRLLGLEEAARRRSSLEALGRMAAEIAHEVRNPLGSLELCSTMLLEDLGDQPASRELAEQILLGVRRLSGTVTRLLSTVRGSRGEARSQDVTALVAEVSAFVEPVARSRQLGLEVQPSGRSIEARVDGEGLRQALLNLLGNAFEATPAGGKVRLAVRSSGGDLLVEVGDSGSGIPPSEREKVLEAFYSTRAEGTGLGLAVVERVAHAHGGGVEIDDAPEGGALVRMKLCGVIEAPAAGENRE